MHSSHDKLVNFLTHHGWLFVWVIFLATLGYALHEHREHRDKVKVERLAKSEGDFQAGSALADPSFDIGWGDCVSNVGRQNGTELVHT